MRTYRFREVLTLTGTTRSQLIHWTDVELIAAYGETTGTGHHRRFSFRNLVELRVAVLLAGYGLPVRTMAFIIGQFRGHLNEAGVLDRDEVVWVPGNLEQISRIWTGSAQDLAAKIGHRFFGDQAGLLIHVGGILADLAQATGDQL